MKGEREGIAYFVGRAWSSEGPSGGAAATRDFYCFNKDEIEMVLEGDGCIDGCGNPLNCFGVITPSVKEKLKQLAAFRKEREVVFDREEIFKEFCGKR